MSLRVIACASCAFVGMLVLPSSSTRAYDAFGLTDNNTLVQFDTATPGTIADTVAVTGLQSGDALIGIDFRPANGVLYGLGLAGRLYSLDTTTGAATQVGTGTFAVALDESAFGIDFNPTVDRLRLVSANSNQNLRINPDTGAVVDGDLVTDGIQGDTNLAYKIDPPADVNADVEPNVVGAAYTNNLPTALTTVLYGIDSNLDILVTQAPPNAGTLNTVGALGVDTNNFVGFDIVTDDIDQAFASLSDSESVASLYTINLGTGAATLIGGIGDGPTTITALAIRAPSDVQPPVIPLPNAAAMFGVMAGALGVVQCARRMLRRR